MENMACVLFNINVNEDEPEDDELDDDDEDDDELDDEKIEGDW